MGKISRPRFMDSMPKAQAAVQRAHTPQAPAPEVERYQHVSMDRMDNRPTYEMRTASQLPPKIQELLSYQKQQNLANTLRAEEMGWGKYAPEQSKTPQNTFFDRFNRRPTNTARSGYPPRGRNPQTTANVATPRHGRAQWGGQRFRTNTEA